MEFDNLDDLRVLLATAETGSLTAGGKRCGLSTAAVSAALKRLERSLGCRLFERTTRSVRATPEGEVMIDHARQALDLVAQGRALVNGGATGLSGPVRVTIASVLARELLADWLAEFAGRHPGITIDLAVSDSHLDLVRDGIDLALRNGPLPDSTLAARLLAPGHRVACASPAYLARCGWPQQPQDLARHECLVTKVRDRHHGIWSFEPTAGSALAPCQVKVQGRLACNDAAIAQQWALQGRGVVYLPEAAGLAAFSSGDLVRLFPGYVGEPAPLYAVLPSNRFVPMRVRALMDGLASLFAERLEALRRRA